MDKVVRLLRELNPPSTVVYQQHKDMLPVLRLGGKNNAESLKRPVKGSTVSNDKGLCQFSSCQSMLQSSMHSVIDNADSKFIHYSIFRSFFKIKEEVSTLFVS